MNQSQEQEFSDLLARRVVRMKRDIEMSICSDRPAQPVNIERVWSVLWNAYLVGEAIVQLWRACH